MASVMNMPMRMPMRIRWFLDVAYFGPARPAGPYPAKATLPVKTFVAYHVLIRMGLSPTWVLRAGPGRPFPGIQRKP